MSKTVEITYELEVDDENETRYKIDLECRISRAEADVGWLGHLEDYDVLSVTPAWGRGVDALYEALDANKSAIAEIAFAAEGDA